MIVEMHKYLIIGNRSEMDRFFSQAQRAAFMEFIGLSHKKALELPEDAKIILAAMRIAKSHSAPTGTIYVAELSALDLAKKIVHAKEEFEKLEEEIRILHAEIARISAFGDFSRDEIDAVESETKRVFQFFCMKNDLASEVSLPPEMIYVGTEYELSYFVAINKEKKQYPKMIEIIIDRPLGQLQERLQQARKEMAHFEHEMHDSARALTYLQEGLYDYLNAYHLELVKHDSIAPLQGTLFAIEAWVPKTKVQAMFGLLSGLGVHAEQIAIEERDRVPTCQENRGMAKVGEDLTHIYDIPASTDKDPSLWVLCFFSLFFSIIISDAGYGLIFLGLGLFLRHKFAKGASAARRLVKMVLVASCGCILWGVLTACYFGIELAPNDSLQKISFMHYLAVKKADYHLGQQDDVFQSYVKMIPQTAQAKDGKEFLQLASKGVDGHIRYTAFKDFTRSILLELSLFIGTVHISLSLLRNLFRNWSGAGWICFLIGGYLYCPSFLNATSFLNFMGWIPKAIAYPTGEQLLYTGFLLVFVLALLQKRKWGALSEFPQAIQMFVDILSYLRLYALAFAGMMMAETFNHLGIKVGIFGGFLIILLGHIVNISLGIMSGTIHGLRLNFLEWYHYSFEGGGRLFNPLRIKKVIHK